MAAPTIIWRNPKSILRRRLWSRARRTETSSLYIVVRSGERESEWEGLPNLEMIDCGGRTAGQVENREAYSRA